MYTNVVKFVPVHDVSRWWDKHEITSGDFIFTESKRVEPCLLMATNYVELVRTMFIFFALY